MHQRITVPESGMNKAVTNLFMSALQNLHYRRLNRRGSVWKRGTRTSHQLVHVAACSLSAQTGRRASLSASAVPRSAL